MDRGSWWATVHGVTKNQTRLSDFTFTFHFHALEKEMAMHENLAVKTGPHVILLFWHAGVFGVMNPHHMIILHNV